MQELLRSIGYGLVLVVVGIVGCIVLVFYLIRCAVDPNDDDDDEGLLDDNQYFEG